MPNQCSCKLSITGEQEILDKFYLENKDRNENKELDFNKSVPTINHKILTQEVNWGTKWGACSAGVDFYFRKLLYSFWVPWQVPKPWLVATSTKYPDLDFELKYEGGNEGTAGNIIVKSGKIISEIEEDMIDTKWRDLKLDQLVTKCLKKKLIDKFDEDELEEFFTDNEPELICNWPLQDTFWEKIDEVEERFNDRLVVIQSLIRKLLAIRDLERRRIGKSIIDFAYSPPEGNSLLKNGGSLYREYKDNFNLLHRQMNVPQMNHI